MWNKRWGNAREPKPSVSVASDLYNSVSFVLSGSLGFLLIF